MSRINLGILNCLPANKLPIGYKKPLVNTFPAYNSIEKLNLIVLKSDVKKPMIDIVNSIKKQINVLVEKRENIETFGVLKNISENATSHICEVDLYIKILT
jgi:hypothetical protein